MKSKHLQPNSTARLGWLGWPYLRILEVLVYQFGADDLIDASVTVIELVIERFEPIHNLLPPHRFAVRPIQCPFVQMEKIISHLQT